MRFNLQALSGPRSLQVLTLLLITVGVCSLPQNRAVFEKESQRSLNDMECLHDNEEHPCHNTKVNKTVISPEGEKILCLVPSEEDLLKTIKESGGFNKHYVAVTAKEAEEDFEDPFNPIAQSQNHPKPGWSWSSRLNATGRRRRSMAIWKYKLGISAASDDGRGNFKRSSGSGLRSCVGQGQINDMGLFQLCDECWWVTVLPDDKFPRYINERICGKDGTSISPPTGFCNSWNGQCIQRSLTQDLLVRTNHYQRIASPDPQYKTVYKQVWEPYSQAIRSCCQCQNF